MNIRGSIMAGALATCIAAGLASATVTITMTGGGGSITVLENFVDGGGERRIQFEVSGTGAMTFRVQATGGTEPIRYIQVRLNSGVTTGKLVVNQDGGTISYVREISRLSGGSTTADFWLNSVDITGDLGGPGSALSGSCEVNYIESVICGGDINADIHLTPFPSGSPTEHEIVLLQCDGDFHGNIEVEEGRIRTLTVGGDIGSATVTPLIHTHNFIQQVLADEIWADFEVADGTPGASDGNFWKMTTTFGGFHGSLKAGRLNGSPSIHTFNIAGNWDADVTLYRDIVTPVDIGGSFPSGTVWTIGREIRTGYIPQPGGGYYDLKNGSVNIDGDFAGTILIEEGVADTGILGGPMTVGGDLETTGLLFIDSSILYTGSPLERRGSLTINEQLKGMVFIGEDLNGPIWAKNLGSSGAVNCLSGQIVINGLDNGSDWLDDVKLGNSSGTPVAVIGTGESQPYQAPYYEVLSSTLGGGAIGLVPFKFHSLESVPELGETLTMGAPTSVTIEHYGPVAEGGVSAPVRVFRAPMWVPFGYSHHSDVPLCYETTSAYYWVEMTGFDLSVSGRVVTVANDTDAFAEGYAYQIIPADLVCDIDGEPDVVYLAGWTGSDDASCEEDERTPVATHGYGFRVVDGMDLNANFEFDEGDIDEWNNDPVDFNGDTYANEVDLAELVIAVANWGG